MPVKSKEQPSGVSIAMNLLIAAGTYALLLSPILLLAGVFSGPEIFFGGVLHLSIGIISIALYRSLANKSKRARQITVVVFAVLSLLTLGSVLWSLPRAAESVDDKIGLAYFASIAVIYAAIPILLCRRDSRAWFNRTE